VRAAALLCLMPLAAGCGAHQPAPPATAGAPRPADRTPTLCRTLHVRVTGRVPDASANELSGLVRSPSHPGLLWSHDDSGSGPLLYGLRADGRVVARPTVTGAQAVDWEDIAAGAGPTLYIGDIGDNDGNRKTIDVYRVREPRVGAAATGPATRLALHYPDGPHDAEALLVDPLRGDIIVVTKALGGATAYRVSGATLRRIGDVPGARFVTGGDVSADGRVVALRGYDRVWVWVRRGREPLATTLRRTPCSPPTSLLPEGQGEAIALDPQGRSFMTVAEGTPAVLRRYVPR
jgi:hypothetical protein